MKKFIVFFLILFCGNFHLFACLNTYQFKVFPVGTANNKIITVDIEIRRTSITEASMRFNQDFESSDDLPFFWILAVRNSVYDKNQKLLTSTVVDTSFAVGSKYKNQLLQVYQNGLSCALDQYPEIKLFTPNHISICDYQKECGPISVHNDTSLSRDYIITENKKHIILIMHDTSHFAFAHPSYNTSSTRGFHISSSRVYKNETTTLFIAHLQNGHEITMAESDTNIVSKTKNKRTPEILNQKNIESIDFDKITNAVYREPLLHHGYGFDVFAVE